MPNPKFSSRIKIAFLNIMQAMGAAASHLASNAKLRVNEINLESRRHEILTEFSLQAFEMWHNGVKLPQKLSDMFTELSEIDDKLSILRAQKFAKVNEESVDTTPEDTDVNAENTGTEVTGAKSDSQISSADSDTESPVKKAADGSVVVKPAAKPVPNPVKPVTKQDAPNQPNTPASKNAVSAAKKKPRATIKKAVTSVKPKDNA